MRIYIAGPYSNDDTVINVRNAILTAEDITSLGHIPFVPHLTMFWHLIVPHPYEFWLSQDMEWLKVCDAILRLPGKSAGADKEVKYCLENNIPVYYSLTEIPLSEEK